VLIVGCQRSSYGQIQGYYSTRMRFRVCSWDVTVGFLSTRCQGCLFESHGGQLLCHLVCWVFGSQIQSSFALIGGPHQCVLV
jgi:hypothetical protein